jgi:hypothetical protein
MLYVLQPITQITRLDIVLIALLRLVHAVLVVREHACIRLCVRRRIVRVALDPPYSALGKRAGIDAECPRGAGECAEHYDRVFDWEWFGVWRSSIGTGS